MLRVSKYIVALTLIAAAVPAHADGVVIQAQVDGSVPGVPRSDLQGPATSGSLLATVTMPEASNLAGGGPAVGRAGQNAAGVSAVSAEVKSTTAGAAILESRTSWTATATNTAGVQAEFVYVFDILAPRLALLDPSGTSSVAPEATYELGVQLGAQTLFASKAVLSGSRFGTTLKKSGTDMGGVFFGTPGSTPFGYQFSPYHGSISLGFYQPGESVTVVATLRVKASTNDPGVGSQAQVGDPLDLSGDPGLLSVIMLSEPVAVNPSTWSAVKELYGGR